MLLDADLVMLVALLLPVKAFFYRSTDTMTVDE
jgi:hypothetical protein